MKMVNCCNWNFEQKNIQALTTAHSSGWRQTETRTTQHQNKNTIFFLFLFLFSFCLRNHSFIFAISGEANGETWPRLVRMMPPNKTSFTSSNASELTFLSRSPISSLSLSITSYFSLLPSILPFFFFSIFDHSIGSDAWIKHIVIVLRLWNS